MKRKSNALWVAGLCTAFLFASTAQAEIKRTIAVAPVDWTAPQVTWTSEGAIEAQLISALNDSGRYRVLERMDLNAMIGEQQIAGGGGLKSLKGAQMLIKPVVTDAAAESSSGRSIRFGGVGGDKEASVFRVTMNMRIYDVQTGDILDTVTVTGKQESQSRNRGGSFGNWDVGKEQSSGTTTGTMTHALIKLAVSAIDKNAHALRWASNVKTIAGGKAVIMGGARDGVEKGMIFELYELGAQIIDDDTGEILDAGEETKVGKLKVTQVKDKVSYLAKVSGKSPKKGNVVKLIEPKKKAPPPAPKAEAKPEPEAEAQQTSSGGRKNRRR